MQIIVVLHALDIRIFHSSKELGKFLLVYDVEDIELLQSVQGHNLQSLRSANSKTCTKDIELSTSNLFQSILRLI
jgi:hypothetical protein